MPCFFRVAISRRISVVDAADGRLVFDGFEDEDDDKDDDAAIF